MKTISGLLCVRINVCRTGLDQVRWHPRPQHLGGRGRMIGNKSQLELQDKSEANLAYMKLKEKWGRKETSERKREEKENEPMREGGD